MQVEFDFEQHLCGTEGSRAGQGSGGVVLCSLFRPALYLLFKSLPATSQEYFENELN